MDFYKMSGVAEPAVHYEFETFGPKIGRDHRINFCLIRQNEQPLASVWNADLVWQDIDRLLNFLQVAGPNEVFKPLYPVPNRNLWKLRRCSPDWVMFATQMRIFTQGQFVDFVLLPRMGLFYAADKFRRESFPPDLPMAAG